MTWRRFREHKATGHNMENKGEIYLITCNINNKKYIGQAVCYINSKNKLRLHGTEGRWKKHLYEAYGTNNRCRALNTAIVKYGQHNFSVKTIFICEKSKLNYYEFKYSRLYNTLAPFGYNIRKCGGSKGNHSRETIDKLKIAKSGEKNHMYGKHHTEEAKSKISKANTGKKCSDDAKSKISKSNTGKKRSDDFKKNLSIKGGKGRRGKCINLPMYIYHIKTDKSEGYMIKNHPKLKLSKKSYTSKKYTMGEKLQMAIEYIKNL